MNKSKSLPSQDYLNSILEYRNGFLYWKIYRASKKIKPGDKAGCINNKGYYQLSLDNKTYRQHNIIWKMFTGNDPKEQIDHINHDKTDNRIENLREVSNEENMKNMSKHKNNTSGYSNIIIRNDNRKKKYVVSIGKNKCYKKSFLTLEEAIQHRDEKYIELNYHPNHGLELKL